MWFILVLLLCNNGSTIPPDTQDDYKMIVTWGKPLKILNPKVLNITWKECIDVCWKDKSCVSDVNREYIFPNDPNKHKFNQYLPYRISLKNNVWTFTTRSEQLNCLPGSFPTRRGTDIWCVNMNPMGTCINQSYANIASQSGYHKPVIGFANLAEYEAAKAEVKGLLENKFPGAIPAGYTSVGFWIDGVRKAACIFPSPKSASCNGTNEFTYSDPYAKSPMLDYLPNKPDGINRPGSSCVFLYAKNGTIGISDTACDIASNTTENFCMAGFFGGTFLRPDTWI